LQFLNPSYDQLVNELGARGCEIINTTDFSDAQTKQKPEQVSREVCDGRHVIVPSYQIYTLNCSNLDVDEFRTHLIEANFPILQYVINFFAASALAVIIFSLKSIMELVVIVKWKLPLHGSSLWETLCFGHHH